MKPPRSIFDPKFKYVNSASTNVARTFRKARLLQRLRQSNVTTLPGKKVANGK